MATTVVTSYPEPSMALCEWLALGVAESGDSVTVSRWSDKTVTCEGTFGGASVNIEGSNNGSVWYIAQDFMGLAMTFTVAGMKVLASNPRYLRAVTVGGAATVLNVRMYGRMQR